MGWEFESSCDRLHFTFAFFVLGIGCDAIYLRRRRVEFFLFLFSFAASSFHFFICFVCRSRINAASTLQFSSYVYLINYLRIEIKIALPCLLSALFGQRAILSPRVCSHRFGVSSSNVACSRIYECVCALQVGKCATWLADRITIWICSCERVRGFTLHPLYIRTIGEPRCVSFVQFVCLFLLRLILCAQALAHQFQRNGDLIICTAVPRA